MLELDGVVALLLVGLWLYCVLDVVTTPEGEARNLPKLTWLFVVIVLSDVGSVLWLIAGRPRAADGGRARPGPASRGAGGAATRSPDHPSLPTRRPRRAPVAPDDDPAFLAGLADQARRDRERAQQLERWEDDLARREQQLREQEGDPPQG